MEKFFSNKKDIAKYNRRAISVIQSGDSQKVIQTRKELFTITDHIFHEMRNFAKLHKIHLILCIDTARHYIYQGKDPKMAPIYMLNEIAVEAANNSEIPILDLTDAFMSNYLIENQKFEFDIDGHWTRHGHLKVSHPKSKNCLG